MRRAESQERDPRMSVLEDQLIQPLHFQMEKLKLRAAEQSAQITQLVVTGAE